MNIYTRMKDIYKEKKNYKFKNFSRLVGLRTPHLFGSVATPPNDTPLQTNDLRIPVNYYLRY